MMCYIIVTNCRYRYIIHNYSEKEVFHKACLLWLSPNTNETTDIYLTGVCKMEQKDCSFIYDCFPYNSAFMGTILYSICRHRI